MTCQETQEEELEVLRSIYDGDELFKELSTTCFQYMIGESSDPKSFLLEISWGQNYPDAAPSLNLDAFHNKKLIPEVKDEIINRLHDEAQLLLGTAMTYTLIEWAKEQAPTLMTAQPEKIANADCSPPSERESSVNGQVSQSTKAEKKPKLSKQQKRKLYEKLDSKGEHARGWDWVDVVKHLSQTAGKSSNDANS